ncbi:MAG: alpha/beta hydrolase [Verrucomicrobia bacterium]|nr:alpha/beta hydrolase [Verrucomicrobiota bacterium]
MWKKLLARGRQIWGLSLSAGLLGAFVLALRYASGPSAKPRLPDSISPAIFATRILHTSRGQLVYHESGQGGPLVFLHGIYVGASSYEWSKVYPHFAGTHQVLAVDMLGFGESERSDGPLSAADHVQALVEFIRAKSGGERTSIIASGFAAGFATILAAQHPELVQRLILLMPLGRVEFGRQRLPKRFGLLTRPPFIKRAFYRRYLSTRVQIRAWLKNFAFFDPEKIADETIEVLTNCAQQFGAERAIFQWLSRRFDFDLEQRLAELSQAVTLIWGEKAVYPPLELGYRLQSVAKQCSLVILPNAGSLAPLESPMQVAEMLIQELDPTIRIYNAG